MTSKRDFQQLAHMHAQDACQLFKAGRHTNAHHLTGLAIECALKALVCDHLFEGVLPDPKVVQRAHSHDLDALAGLAGLKPALSERVKDDADFEARWSIVRAWSITARYETISLAEAQELLDAALSPEGVLEWIKTHW